MKQFADKQKRTLMISILLFLLLAGIITAVGYKSYRNFELQTRAEAESWLSEITNSKVNGLADWRKDMLGNVNFTYENRAFSDSVALYFKDRQDAKAREYILNWLEAYQKNDEIDGVYLLDMQGTVIFSVPAERYLLASAITDKIPEVRQSEQLTFIDFYLDESDQQVYLAMLTPILDKYNSQHVIGFLVLRIDPQVRLYPVLAQQNTNSAPTQSFLVRREGNDAVFLSEVRFKSDAAVNLHIPIAEKENLAVQAVLGQTEIMEGVDYYDIATIAVAQSVPNSPWFLVTYMDTLQVYAPVREYFWGTIIVTGIIIFYSSLGMVLIWRQRQLKHYQTEAQAAEVLLESEERFRSAFQYSAIGMALVSLEGKWLKVNSRLSAILGYSEEELLTRTFQSITYSDDLEADLNYVQQMLEGKLESYTIEKRYLHKEGRIVWVLLAKALIRDSAGAPLYFISQIEDITERKLAEEELREFTQSLDNKVHERTEELQNVNQKLFQEKQRAELLVEDVKESREQLRALSQQMVDLQEKQIKNLARELHDSVGQNLTAININLSLLGQTMPENYPESIRLRLTDTSQIVEETVARMRNIMADFLPPMLESYGLSPTLSWYGEQFTKRTNIPVNVNDYRLSAVRLPPETEVGMFRIVQEALNNAAKYAHAAQVDIELKDDGDSLLMMITDDGVGFDLQAVFAKPAHWGFAIMRERAKALDASFDIQSTPGKGTTILLRMQDKNGN